MWSKARSEGTQAEINASEEELRGRTPHLALELQTASSPRKEAQPIHLDGLGDGGERARRIGDARGRGRGGSRLFVLLAAEANHISTVTSTKQRNTVRASMHAYAPNT